MFILYQFLQSSKMHLPVLEKVRNGGYGLFTPFTLLGRE
jgi:hypothetical protein